MERERDVDPEPGRAAAAAQPATHTDQNDRAYHHGALAEAAIEAGFTLARREGPSAVTMRSVASAVGVAHRALYRHFPDREALIDAITERVFALLFARLDAAGPAFVRAYVRFAIDEPFLFDLAHTRADARGADGRRSSMRALLERAKGRLAPDGDALQQRDRVVAGLAAIYGILILWRAGCLEAATPEHLEAYIEAMACSGAA